MFGMATITLGIGPHSSCLSRVFSAFNLDCAGSSEGEQSGQQEQVYAGLMPALLLNQQCQSTGGKYVSK